MACQSEWDKVQKLQPLECWRCLEKREQILGFKRGREAGTTQLVCRQALPEKKPDNSQ